ncbi:MAG TPA: hypothetical protein VHQ70_07820, partial [Syntrophomonadaceae bacterium]|nr:hypothetical protein [Syntrophomonadaceae bacterium]
MGKTHNNFNEYVPSYEKLWIKQYDEGVKRHLPVPNMTLKDFMLHWVSLQPDKPHIIYKDRIITYKESNALACKLANALLRLG